MRTWNSIVDFVEKELQASTEVTRFPSGAVNIDIRCGERFIVVQYSPSLGFGVSELRESEIASFTGHDAAFARPEDVIAHLRSLLS